MDTSIDLGFDDAAFIAAVAQEVSTPGVRPTAAARRFLSNHLSARLRDTLGARLIKDPLVKLRMGSRGLTLSDLSKIGAEDYYTELRFSTRPADAIASAIVRSRGFELVAFEYGGGVRRDYQLKTRALKTQTNHELRLNHLRLPGVLFAGVRDALAAGEPLAQPWLANPNALDHAALEGLTIMSYRLVCFEHVLDGSRVFCSCSAKAHVAIRAKAASGIEHYASGGHRHKVLDLLAGPTYLDGICHLCVARASGVESAALRYGDNLADFEKSYMNQLMSADEIDERTARAEIQQQLGLSRWKSEAKLYSLIKELFPTHMVQREASPSWLGRQRLDILVPQLSLALEYQGQQHFGPVSLFGGEEGWRRAVERDTVKKSLCDANGIDLVYVHHTHPLTLASLRQRLQRYL